MKKALLMFSIIGVLTITSCSKNKADLVPEEQKESILTSAEYSSTHNGIVESDQLSFSYDQHQRISSIAGNRYGVFMSEKISYDKDKIILYGEHLNSWGMKYNYNTTYKLDVQGRIISMPDLYYNSVVLFSYNAEGFLTETRNTYIDPYWKNSITNVKTFTYTNGNLTRIVSETDDSYYSGKVNRTVSTITYTIDELNNDIVSYKLYESIFREEADLSHLTAFLGKRSKNLPKKLETTAAYWSSLNTTTTETNIRQFTYQKNTKGNVLSIKFTDFPAPPISSTLNETYHFFYSSN